MGNPIGPISAFNSTVLTPTTEAAPQPVTPPATPVEDTVELSAEARARLLDTQGQSVPEIASNLEVTSKVVVSYLGETQLDAEIAAASQK
jgi:hypothetical protein